jgi:hypothetical protein
VAARLLPGALVDIDQAEAEAERLTVEYLAGEGTGDSYAAALERWEALLRGAAVALGRLCHDCGRETVAAMLDPSTGDRFCRDCLRPGGRP